MFLGLVAGLCQCLCATADAVMNHCRATVPCCKLPLARTHTHSQKYGGGAAGHFLLLSANKASVHGVHGRSVWELKNGP